MCTLVVELLMLLAGVYALMAGKLQVTNKLRLKGWRARVAGLILIAPVPLALLAGVVLSLLVDAGALSESVVDYVGIIDMALVLLALAAAVIFGYAMRDRAGAEEPQPPAG